jgi:hypothetical protein
MKAVTTTMTRLRVLFAALLLCTFAASAASAEFVNVYGGPTYDGATQTGYLTAVQPAAPGDTAGNGAAVGYATKYSSGTSIGTRAYRWDASGSAAVELGNLGTSGNGMTNVRAYALNGAGLVVGWASKYTSGVDLGNRAVRWAASGTAATELGNLGTNAGGTTTSQSFAVNSAGTASGWAEKYTAGTYLGSRAVRWDAFGTVATELDNLGTDSGGFANGQSYALNSAGAAVGWANKYTGGISLGNSAVRWDASGTAAIELGNLGADSGGRSYSYAYAINSVGAAFGYSEKYIGGTYQGDRAVRWDASGTAATELGNLGTNAGGTTTSQSFAVNSAGTASGWAEKYTAGTYLGSRAVRWDALGTVTELGNLGTTGGGTFCRAYAMNDAGATVGWANEYEGGTYVGDRAVLWNSDGVAFDLNTLIDPDSGWTLFEADGISDTNWVSGIGLFDPDGAGPLGAYDRAFLLDASSAVPESASFCLLACASTLLTLRRGRSAQLPAAAGIPTSKSSAGVRSPRLTVVMTLSGLIDVRNSLTHQVAGTSTQSLRPRESNPAFTNSTCYAREGESLRGFDRGARYC